MADPYEKDSLVTQCSYLQNRIEVIEKRLNALMIALGRIFDLSWDEPDSRQILIELRESIMAAGELRGMKEPTLDEMLNYIRSSMKYQEMRYKSVMSYIRMLVATVLGIVSTLLVTKMGWK